MLSPNRATRSAVFASPALLPAVFGQTFAALSFVLMTAALPAGATVIDSFDTAQPEVTLQAPGQIGQTLGNAQAAPEALGGIRNYQATLLGGTTGNRIRAFVGGGLYNHVQDPSVTGRSMLIWDGNSTPLTVDPTGLRFGGMTGVDLTDGGVANALEVRLEFADLGALLQMEVYTDANNRSVHQLSITSTATQQIFIVPFSAFTQSSGAAGPADLTNVGAVTVRVDGASTAALDVQLDLLQTIPTLIAEKSAALLVDTNGNGLVDAGDEIQYQVVVQNIGTAPANNVMFNDTVDANSTLNCTAPGDPATTQGTVTLCDDVTGQLTVDIGTLGVGAGNAVTITFNVLVDTPIPPGTTQICNQGFFDTDTLLGRPTDDPATFGIPNDPTCLPVASKIIIQKITDPVGSPQSFEFAGDLNGGLFALTGGNSFMEELAPGMYTVVELAVPNWQLTGLVCDDPTAVIDLLNRSVIIDLGGGEVVTCTFTNTQDGSITVVKQTDPPGSPQTFDFTGSLGNFSLSDGQFVTQFFPPGTYNTAEINIPTGWQLQSATCDDGSPVGAISLQAGEDIICTFVNAQEGDITIVKNTIGGDGSFSFTSTTLTPSPFTIVTTGGTGSQNFGPLPPGLYDVAETIPTGWDLTSATCSDGSPIGAIDLNGGESITCTFTDTRRGNLIVVKNALGGDDTFNFNSISPGGFSIVTSGGTGSQSFPDLIPGIYDASEAAPPLGWQFIGASCSDGSPIGAIDIAPGETVTCTFTNERLGIITIVKNTIGADGTFDFVSVALGNFQIVTAGNTGSVSFTLLPSGIYDVSESVPAGWTLTNTVCSDGSTIPNIGLDPGESVTCTFTDALDGTIIVEKFTDPTGSTQAFDFTGSLGNFQLLDGQSTSMSFPPGTYNVNETVPAGWQLVSATCSDGSPVGAISLQAGETVTCTFINGLNADITIVKNTIGGDGSFTFTSSTLSPSPFTIVTAGNTGSQSFGPLAPGIYDVAETVPAGWDLISATCSDGSPINAIDLAGGESVTCTFTDRQRGALIVQKIAQGGDDTFGFGSFSLTPAAFNIVTAGGTGSMSFSDLIPGTYDVSEITIPPGWNLTAASCSDGSPINAIDIAAGETVTCTFTNQRQGDITIIKNTIGADGTFTFNSIALGPFPITTTGNTGSQGFSGLVPGNYDIAEAIPAGWQLTGLVCNDPTGNSVVNLGTGSANIALDPGESVSCTFTDTQEGTIIVEKQTTPDGAPDLFAFSGDASGSISDGQQIVVGGLLPGNYTSTEAALAGWTLGSIVCNDTNSSGNVGARTANFVLEAGETVTCVFNNTQQSQITIVKNTIGGDGSFNFTGNLGPFNLATAAGTAQTTFSNLAPGAYNVAETVPAGWTLTSQTCDNGNSPGAITLGAGESVTCTFVNTLQGTIIVEKQTLPDGSAQSFTFAGNAAGTIGDGGTIIVNNLDPGVYTSTETVPGGWDLTSIVCDDTDSSGNTGTATATFNLQAGETVRCVFTNTQRGTIVVEKQTLPDGSAQSFTFSGDATGNITDGQQITVGNLVPGNYSATETLPAGWDLTSVVCNDANSTGDTGTATAGFVLDPGETVTCVFTNTQRGTIVVEKQTLPDGAPDAFTFTGDATGNITDGQQITVGNLVPGNYSSVETVPASWNLTGITCDDTNSSGDIGTATASFVLDPGETVTCVFTNTQGGSITVEKQTLPDGSTQAFTFAGDVAGAITDGNSITVPVDPGTYTSTETLPAGWDLTSIVCDDANSSGNTGTATATFNVEAGEAVRCVFTNTQRATIVVVKQAVGGDGAFDFTSATLTPAAFTLTTAAGTAQQTFADLVPGNYDVAETVPAGWTLTSQTCDNGNAPAAITVNPGETVTCTFVNTIDGSITIVKQADPPNTGTLFDFIGDLGTFDLLHGESIVQSLPPGIYSVSEVLPLGWLLQSAVCSDGSPINAIDLAAGENITCTFNNTLTPPAAIPTLSRTGLLLLAGLMLLFAAANRRRPAAGRGGNRT